MHGGHQKRICCSGESEPPRASSSGSHLTLRAQRLHRCPSMTSFQPGNVKLIRTHRHLPTRHMVTVLRKQIGARRVHPSVCSAQKHTPRPKEFRGIERDSSGSRIPCPPASSPTLPRADSRAIAALVPLMFWHRVTWQLTSPPRVLFPLGVELLPTAAGLSRPPERAYPPLPARNLKRSDSVTTP